MFASLKKKTVQISPPLLSSEKEGIVTILRSDQVNSLRRAISADMSSKNWLAQYGLSPAMKKIASAEEFSVSIPDSSSSSQIRIREENRRTETERPPLPIDNWSSILYDRDEEEASKSLLPPYIHPLVKRSASSLSEKSLEICTESLGSETGSDGFSSDSPSETGEDDKDEEEETQTVKMEEMNRAVKLKQKKPASRSFPPPLPWLSSSAGASIRVQSRRENGRLTLEAVYSPSHRNFLAHRQHSRLVLSFAHYEDLGEDDPEKEDEEYSETAAEEEEDREAGEDEDHRRTKFPRLEIIMENRVNEETKSEAEELSLKPRPSPPLTAAIEAPSFTKALALTKLIREENPSSTKKNSSSKLIFSKKSMESKQKKQGDGDCFASFSKKCKEPRKSLLFWEPNHHCLAASS